MTHTPTLFTHPCQFIHGAAMPDDLPQAAYPEIAFIGRSNVGKSSLINALTHRKDLARTSNTPGRTQQLNFFQLGSTLMLVDMPGYGYAKASKKDRKIWDRLIKSYLLGRPNLLRVYIMIDSRRGILPVDHDMMAMLDEAAVSYQLVLTKADKLGNDELEPLMVHIEHSIATRPACYPRVLATSTVWKRGIEEMQEAIITLLNERQGTQ